MAQITINEVSQNYTYSTGNSAFATVALPITASWGPGYLDPATVGAQDQSDFLDNVVWERFPSTQSGMEQFVATYRGPATNYRLVDDYSYQMALTLLNAGYDVLVCRLAPGNKADSSITIGTATLLLKAKYPGSFGNNIICQLLHKQLGEQYYWSLIVKIEDPSTHSQIAVENLAFTFEMSAQESTIPHISEVSSKFVDMTVSGTVDDDEPWVPAAGADTAHLTGGADWMATPTSANIGVAVFNQLKLRYGDAAGLAIDDDTDACKYAIAVKHYVLAHSADTLEMSKVYYTEWLYSSAYKVYGLLEDKLSYNPQRIISPAWDDQNIAKYSDMSVYTTNPFIESPLHTKIMTAAYFGRCAAGLLDEPVSCTKAWFYNDDPDALGYAQKLSRYSSAGSDVNAYLFSSHSALFANWAKYTLVGMARPVHMPPAFLHLLIHRSQMLNQPAQYEWLLPSNKTHKVSISSPDFTVSKHVLDTWQSQEGVGVNILAPIPDMGMMIWGNSTLFELPPATYQALANLSTRYLVNAIEDRAFRCGIAITFQYNNSQAYDKFYAGCSPLLETMRNQGAITDWYIRMAADLDGLDQVNANSVVGQIYITVEGVINNIAIDLIALPSSVSLDQFRG